MPFKPLKLSEKQAENKRPQPQETPKTTLGNLDPTPSGWRRIVLEGDPTTITREGNNVYFNLTFTAAGSTTIYTPPTGKKAQIIGFCIENTADVEALLRFATSQNIVAPLPTKGVVAMNLIGLKEHEGAVNEAVEVYASGATNVRGWICVVEA